jgi:hypothetical protein
MVAIVAPLAVAGDPFAAPRGAGEASLAEPVPASQQAAQSFDASNLPVAGLPTKPQWLLPVIVGVLALVVGGAVTLVVMMGR